MQRDGSSSSSLLHSYRRILGRLEQARASAARDGDRRFVRELGAQIAVLQAQLAAHEAASRDQGHAPASDAAGEPPT
jgi:hypothetical protein